MSEQPAKALDLQGFMNKREKELREAIQARNVADRELAYLIAWLARIYPAVLAPSTDPDCQMIYLRTAEGQLSWPIWSRDAWLFSGVKRVPADDPRAVWDGHTVEQKYNRIQALIQWPRPDDPTPVLPGSEV